MFVSHSYRFSRRQAVLAAADATTTALALTAAVVLRLGWDDGLAYLHFHRAAMLTSWSVFMLAFYLGGLYEPERLIQMGRMLGSALISVAMGALFITAVLYATFSLQVGRGVFLGFGVFVLVAAIGNRLLYLAAMQRGFMARRCLIIGSEGESRKTIELVQQNPHGGQQVMGIILNNSDRERVGKFVAGLPILGTLDALEKFVELYSIDQLILAAAVDYEPVLLKRLRLFRYRGLALIDFVALYEELAQEIPLDHINDEWLFLASLHSSRIHVRRLKRMTDLIVSLVGLLVSAPIAALAALWIKLDSKGPVLFRQERLGRDSEPFTLLKFRTMRLNAESATGPVWAAENDPRITRAGKWLRKFRIDEIPQLVNVLSGEMSLVGPRPERAVFIQKLTEKIPFYGERLLVSPGITGWAQVMHPYAASIEESRRKLQYDLYYIKHMSFLLDIYIFLRTLKTIMFARERKSDFSTDTAAPAPEEIPTETIEFDPAPTRTDADAPAELPDKPPGAQRAG